MKRYVAVAFTLIALLLLTFAVVEANEVPVLSDPRPVLDRGGAVAAVAGVGLLIADVVVPVPSSLVMVAHGALFGITAGAVLSLAGAVGAAMVGFGLGRRGAGALLRAVPPTERRRADTLIERWGVLAVIVSRPVPVLAETVAIMAGASAMRPWPMAAAAAVGALPGAVLYAVVGALAVDVASGAAVFAAVLVIAALTWLVGRGATKRRAEPVVP